MRLPVFAVCVLLGAAPAAAQDTTIVIHPESSGVNILPGQLPRRVAEEVVRFYNAATTSRLVGRTLLPKGNEWRGDVAVRNGPVLVAGRIQGALLVINGDLVVDPARGGHAGRGAAGAAPGWVWGGGGGRRVWCRATGRGGAAAGARTAWWGCRCCLRPGR